MELKMEKLDEFRDKIEKRDKEELEPLNRDIENAFKKGKVKKANKLIVKHNAIVLRQEIDLEILLAIFKELNG